MFLSFFSLTACDSQNPLDKEPAGDSTQNAETTETPEITPPVEPTASPTASPTPEPTKPVELLPVEKLDLSIEGDFCEEKIDEALRGYKDTGEDVTVAVSFGDVPPEDAKRVFFEKYPMLDHYRVLGFLGTDNPDPDYLLLKIPFDAVKELTKENAVISISLFLGYPDNELLLNDSVNVVGIIDGKNVYDALHDPGWETEEWAFDGVRTIGWLTKTLIQMKDDEYARVVVIPNLQPEPIDRILKSAWKESGVSDYNEWLLSEEGKKKHAKLIAAQTVDVFQPIYEEGWIVTREGVDTEGTDYPYLCAIATKKQLEALKLPEDAAYGYKIFFDGIKRGEYQLHNH